MINYNSDSKVVGICEKQVREREFPRTFGERTEGSLRFDIDLYEHSESARMEPVQKDPGFEAVISCWQTSSWISDDQLQSRLESGN